MRTMESPFVQRGVPPRSAIRNNRHYGIASPGNYAEPSFVGSARNGLHCSRDGFDGVATRIERLANVIEAFDQHQPAGVEGRLSREHHAVAAEQHPACTELGHLIRRE